jgi:hypothetical protein
VVEQYGLDDQALVDLAERRDWCMNFLKGDFYIEPRREDGRLVGRDFRFAARVDAVLFKLTFHGQPYGDWP